MQVEPARHREHGSPNPDVTASLVCHVMARVCYDEPRGESCKKNIHQLAQELSAAGRSLPYTAAFAGRADLIRTLIQVGADINKPVRALPVAQAGGGWTPLMIAAAEGHADIVSLLIEAGADLNARNDFGRTALMFASKYGFIAIVEDLLAHGADPNIVPTDHDGWTALIAAAHEGRAETVRVLLDHGADATVKDRQGNNALMWAEAKRHADIADMLRKRQRNPQLKHPADALERRAPLMLGVNRQN